MLYVVLINFNFNESSTVMLGVTNYQNPRYVCEQDTCFISAKFPPSSAGIFNISLNTGLMSFTCPQTVSIVAPVPVLDFCVPTVGITSGGARVTCYFLNIQNALSLMVANISARFESAPASVFRVSSGQSVFAVVLTASATIFEGNATIFVTIGNSSFQYFPFSYVRPCNFETFCSSRGLIPFDLKISEEHVQNDICSETYC